MIKRNGGLPGIMVKIPGGKRPLRIENVVIDFNGTLAIEGRLSGGAALRLRRLARYVNIIVLTSDTFGLARRALDGLPVTVHIIQHGMEKLRLVKSIGPRRVAVVGNGYNDVPMVKAAALGIAVIGDEGASGEMIRAAMVVVRDVNNALDLLLKPKRLIATLRR